MRKNNYNFTHTSYSIINNKSKKIGFFKIEKKIKYENLLKSCDVGLSTVICEKKLLENNKFPNLKTKEDYCLWLKILKNKKILNGLNQELSAWRLTDNSLSSSIFQKIKDSFKLYYIYEKFNFLKAIFFVFRLILNALMKKISIYFFIK